jgi:hypothetical protein
MHTKSGQLLAASRVTGSRLLQQRNVAVAGGCSGGKAAAARRRARRLLVGESDRPLQRRSARSRTTALSRGCRRIPSGCTKVITAFGGDPTGALWAAETELRRPKTHRRRDSLSLMYKKSSDLGNCPTASWRRNRPAPARPDDRGVAHAIAHGGSARRPMRSRGLRHRMLDGRRSRSSDCAGPPEREKRDATHAYPSWGPRTPCGGG